MKKIKVVTTTKSAEKFEEKLQEGCDDGYELLEQTVQVLATNGFGYLYFAIMAKED